MFRFHRPLCRVPSMEEILADSEDSEDEEEERQRGKARKKQARQKGQAWLKEGEEDEPLNFLDPNVSQRVLGEEQSLWGGWGRGWCIARGPWGPAALEVSPSAAPDPSLHVQPPSQPPRGPEK